MAENVGVEPTEQSLFTLQFSKLLPLPHGPSSLYKHTERRHSYYRFYVRTIIFHHDVKAVYLYKDAGYVLLNVFLHPLITRKGKASSSIETRIANLNRLHIYVLSSTHYCVMAARGRFELPTSLSVYTVSALPTELPRDINLRRY